MLSTLQINKKNIPYRPFKRAIDETLKILEEWWPFLHLLPKYWSSALPAYAYKMVITTVCVQIDNFLISWHAFVSHVGMFLKIKLHLFSDYRRQ